MRACAGQVLRGSNSGAPADGGPCGGDHGVWYTFRTNSVGGAARISLGAVQCPGIAGMGEVMGVAVLAGDGSCLPGSFTEVPGGCGSGSGAFSFRTGPLDPATTYWIFVGGTLEGGALLYPECSFQLTVDGPGVDVVGVDLSAGEDQRIARGGSTLLQARGGTGHVWNPPTGLSDILGPSQVAMPTETTHYTVTATVDGCVFSDTVIVRVTRSIAPPNTFTPNGDGYNDTWVIPGIEDFPRADVRIFDRWGQVVFQSFGYREPFDGRGLPTATYYWHIDLGQAGEGIHTGYVAIVR